MPVKFNDFKEKVRVCKNCHNALEKTYQDHLAEIEASKSSELANNERDPYKISNIKLVGDYNQPMLILPGIVKNIIDSIGNLASNPEQAKIEATEARSTGGSEKSPVEDDDGLFDSFEEDDSSSDQFESTNTGQSELQPVYPPLPPKNGLRSTDSPSPSPIPVAKSSHHSFSQLLSSFELERPKTTSSSSLVSTSVSRLKRLGLKKETIVADYGYLGKIPLDESETVNVKWERSYLILFDDLTIGVFPNDSVILVYL